MKTIFFGLKFYQVGLTVFLLVLDFHPGSCQIPELQNSDNFKIIALKYSNSSGERGITEFEYNAPGLLAFSRWKNLSGERSSINRYESNSKGEIIEKTRLFRESIGLEPGDRMILQPTRIIQRKGIEFAIDLVEHLRDERNKLVISHQAGDEGMEYAEWLQEYACDHGVDLRLFSTGMADPLNGNGHSGCSLWDVYPFADFITFPSLYEGFGNAFLEAVYGRFPALREWDAKMLVAVNCEYSARDFAVKDGDEVALMPPVQGG